MIGAGTSVSSIVDVINTMLDESLPLTVSEFEEWGNPRKPAGYARMIRTLKRDPNPLLFKINLTGSDGGASGRYDPFRETAFDFAFLLTQLGIRE